MSTASFASVFALWYWFSENLRKKAADAYATSILPIYHKYLFAVTIIFFASALLLLLPPGNVSDGISSVMLAFQTGMIDNVPIIFAFFRRPSQKNMLRTVGLCCLMTAMWLIGILSLRRNLPCKWCAFYFPGKEIVFLYGGFAIFYFFCLLSLKAPNFLAILNIPTNLLRPAVTTWVTFLCISYSSSALALLTVWVEPASADGGYCGLLFAAIIYTVGFAPCVYKTLIDESAALGSGIGGYDGYSKLPSGAPRFASDNSVGRVKLRLADFNIRILTRSELEPRGFIGAGAYGNVTCSVDRCTGTLVAVKEMLPVMTSSSSDDHALDEFAREVELLSRLRHPNILRLVGAVVEVGRLSIVTEYCERGSIFSLLHNHRRSVRLGDTDGAANPAGSSGGSGRTVQGEQLPPATRLSFAHDTAAGMTKLHTYLPMVLHRDLKTANLLVAADWSVRVADFGLSRARSHNTMSKVGTPSYCAPEILSAVARGTGGSSGTGSESSDSYGAPSDVFSFGVVLWELLTGRIPFEGVAPAAIVAGRISGALHLRAPRASTCPEFSQGVLDLCGECLSLNPDDRPDFVQIRRRLQRLLEELALGLVGSASSSPTKANKKAAQDENAGDARK